MNDSLRDALLADYHRGQAQTSSSASYADIRALWPYFRANYGSELSSLPRGSHILEVGPGQGALLAWLRDAGFEHVDGIDKSPGDVQFANAHLGSSVVALGEAVDFLIQHRGEYDVIVMKAVLEHIAKDELYKALSATAAALRPSGFAIIDVPNMDWLLAGHERYMDLTHEVGFTRESLSSLLRLTFGEISIRASRLAKPTRSQRLLRKPLLNLIRAGLYVLGEGANEVLFSSRSLIAIARRPQVEAS